MLDNQQKKQYDDFPVQALVKDVYLKKIHYSEEGDYLQLSFNRKNAWLNERIYNPKKNDFSSTELYKSAKLRVIRCLEHIASTFLSTEEEVDTDAMNDLRDNPGGDFKSYCLGMIDVLNRLDYTKVKLEIKTIKFKDRVRLPYNPFFMKRAGIGRITLAYSNYEKENLT